MAEPGLEKWCCAKFRKANLAIIERETWVHHWWIPLPRLSLWVSCPKYCPMINCCMLSREVVSLPCLSQQTQLTSGLSTQRIRNDTELDTSQKYDYYPNFETSLACFRSPPRANLPAIIVRNNGRNNISPSARWKHVLFSGLCCWFCW